MIEVSAGIVVSKGKILCMQKGSARYPYLSYKYEFPGGKIESDETPLDALVRELNEELHSDVVSSDIEEWKETEHAYPDFEVRLRFFIIRTDHFDFTLTEHKSYLWSDRKELHLLDWADADNAIIPALEEYLAD